MGTPITTKQQAAALPRKAPRTPMQNSSASPVTNPHNINASSKVTKRQVLAEKSVPRKPHFADVQGGAGHRITNVEEPTVTNDAARGPPAFSHIHPPGVGVGRPNNFRDFTQGPGIAQPQAHSSTANTNTNLQIPLTTAEARHTAQAIHQRLQARGLTPRTTVSNAQLDTSLAMTEEQRRKQAEDQKDIVDAATVVQALDSLITYARNVVGVSREDCRYALQEHLKDYVAKASKRNPEFAKEWEAGQVARARSQMAAAMNMDSEKVVANGQQAGKVEGRSLQPVDYAAKASKRNPESAQEWQKMQAAEAMSQMATTIDRPATSVNRTATSITGNSTLTNRNMTPVQKNAEDLATRWQEVKKTEEGTLQAKVRTPKQHVEKSPNHMSQADKRAERRQQVEMEAARTPEFEQLNYESPPWKQWR
ncbi:hypothetical protein LTR91_026260 [Friedmanniomyces endolithicus]|uniref:Uncharacterized protein n=1 Tax=Friedmanniomyces endolithicus TaxID=329885 RepID=A0AAN6GXK8_9PEZI|nr:hypothetical protein LTR94_012023 [Friedmanniomyces endolithicus]KAK0794240.1 hypothetical protein LTR59_007885 [Friedmanniomyces endolithicus]KAK0795634.1 hypothetical protein LTR75_010460 [Friedmanniomyces endolithicus]KAK0811151.1 hypothetical protein LTR38_003756 [Friedmanniomyces endolithicus]KAK0867681.1 hypothetical protein LTS02_004060 [Friedmanniomyces endolithicus]